MGNSAAGPFGLDRTSPSCNSPSGNLKKGVMDVENPKSGAVPLRGLIEPQRRFSHRRDRDGRYYKSLAEVEALMSRLGPFDKSVANEPENEGIATLGQRYAFSHKGANQRMRQDKTYNKVRYVFIDAPDALAS